ncbi:energy transducer TonB [Flavobacterium sp. B17]|uniref:energy transducer TonB n=1 Tax=Flavobacterium sp. B17 TaxID=95618 RepID=UPI0006786253|nr:hypothetical protein [Flavobacterium sp. B17]
MKKYFSFLSILIISFYSSQQTEGLRLIKEKYIPEFEGIISKYKNITTSKLSKKELKLLQSQKEKELNALEFKRNDEYLAELANIKANPPVVHFDPKTIQPLNEKGEIQPIYPTGINGFKQEIADKFCAGNINAKGKISTVVTMIIEKDGSIVNVKAEGTNDDFNRQAELAVYLTEYKWEPARINGYPVRYRFRIPLNLNFD